MFDGALTCTFTFDFASPEVTVVVPGPVLLFALFLPVFELLSTNTPTLVAFD